MLRNLVPEHGVQHDKQLAYSGHERHFLGLAPLTQSLIERTDDGVPAHRNLVRFGGRGPHTHGRQAARTCDLVALNLAGLCKVVPYAHDPAWAEDSPFIPKSGRRLALVQWRGAGGLAAVR